MARKYLIIGCGSAGLAALEKIRSLTSEDEVRLVTKENCLPYSPTCLPYLLAGRIKETDMWIGDKEYFQSLKASWLKGKNVIKVLPEEKKVVYDDGTFDRYDALLVASGSEPVKPPIDGLEQSGAMSFHTLGDCYKLRSALAHRKGVTILGAGLVGMELALALCEVGCRVKVVEKEARVLPLYFHERAAAYITDIFLDHGVRIFTNKEVVGVRGRGEKIEVSCTDGDVFATDLLLTCVGVRPRTSFLADSGVRINVGVVVDRRMKTNIEGIYAAGDVAEAPDFFFGQPGINAIIPNAVVQGGIAGANMVGEEEEFKGWISMNVFNFFSNMACSIGLCLAEEEDKQILEKEGRQEKSVKRLVFENDKLIGAMFVNEEVDPGVIHYLIENRIELKDHKELLLERTKEASRWLMLEAEKKQAMSLEG